PGRLICGLRRDRGHRMRPVPLLQRAGSILAEGCERTLRQDAFPFGSDHRLPKAFRPQALAARIQGDGIQGREVSQSVCLLASALVSNDRRAPQVAAWPYAAGLAARTDDLSTAIRASSTVKSLCLVDRLTPAWTSPADLQNRILFDLDIMRDVRRLGVIA